MVVQKSVSGRRHRMLISSRPFQANLTKATICLRGFGRHFEARLTVRIRSELQKLNALEGCAKHRWH
jgi:hypothetical protein